MLPYFDFIFCFQIFVKEILKTTIDEKWKQNNISTIVSKIIKWNIIF